MRLPILFALPLAFAACSSHPPKKIVVASSAVPLSRRVADPSGLRMTEQLREYRFGRYVDPGDPLVMHDAHPVYRVEQTAAWNLRADATTASTRPAPIAERTTATQRDAELAELNKQRAATRAFTEQTAALNQRLAELGKAVAQTSEVAKQSLVLKQEMAAVRERLDALQEQSQAQRPETGPNSTAPADDRW